MGSVSSDRDELTGQGCYVGSMALFRPAHVRLVEQALLEAPTEGMTGKQVWEATNRAVPEHTAHLILQEMASKGLAERTTTARKGRRAISVFRAL